MGRRSNQIRVDNLSSFLGYLLGRRPDELGLVPDREGFFPFKEIIQAMHEESGWSYVRQSHINEVLIGRERHLFQVKGKRIRAVKRTFTPPEQIASAEVPGLLYTAVRRKAHPVVMEKGVRSPQERYVVLSGKRQMAERLGKRKDSRPVILEVMGKMAKSEDVSLYCFGSLFLCPYIPADFIAGPPVSKDALQQLREEEESKPVDFRPGTFVMDPSMDPDPRRRGKGRKPKGWKEDSRKIRKMKG